MLFFDHNLVSIVRFLRIGHFGWLFIVMDHMAAIVYQKIHLFGGRDTILVKLNFLRHLDPFALRHEAALAMPLLQLFPGPLVPSVQVFKLVAMVDAEVDNVVPSHAVALELQVNAIIEDH